jgi:hypothetical protein
MAIMLRQARIPSRNVTGFVGGSYNRFGRYYAVREGDAHSWVEAYIGDATTGSWVTFDPTPPAGAQPLEATTGFLVYMRDLAEAISQDWNRYVISYDLRTQVRILDDVARRYESLRGRAGVNKGPLERVTSAPGVASLGLFAFVVGYWIWRRGRGLGVRAGKGPEEALDRRLGDAAELYRSLERALAAQGLARPPSLPPLRHAEQLAACKHPLGLETLSLTEIYLEARFGHAALTEATRRQFEQRVSAIRSFKAPSPGA